MTPQERSKLLMRCMDNITQMFLDEVPANIMSTPEGSRLMYDCILNYMYHLTQAVGIDQAKLEEHIRFVFDTKSQEYQMKLN